jgi:hypothetical protein
VWNPKITMDAKKQENMTHIEGENQSIITNSRLACMLE